MKTCRILILPLLLTLIWLFAARLPARAGMVRASAITLTYVGYPLASGLAVDSTHNLVYYSDMVNVYQLAADGSTTPTVKPILVARTLSNPNWPLQDFGYGALAVDSTGNVYYADTYNDNIGMISYHNIVNGLTSVTYPTDTNYYFETYLYTPLSLAVDSAGDLFVSNVAGGGAITELPVNSTTSSGYGNPFRIPNSFVPSGSDGASLTVDPSGNLYSVVTKANAVYKYSPATRTWAPFFTAPAYYFPFYGLPNGIALDVNSFPDTMLYLAGSGSPGGNYPNSNGTILGEGNATSDALTVTGQPAIAVATDSKGNLFLLTGGGAALAEMQNVSVNNTPLAIPIAGGNGYSIAVTPNGSATPNLTGVFTPTTTQPSWIHLSVSSSSVGFNCDPNNGANATARSAYINVLGVSVMVNQAGNTYSLGSHSLTEPASAGSGSVTLTVTPNTGAWNASANSAWPSWLHLSAANQSGTGSGTVTFTYDANYGGPRTGTLTIANQSVTVTQAGYGYIPAWTTGALISGLATPYGVTVDANNNVYVADSGSKAVVEWEASGGQVTLASASAGGLTDPLGVAVDSAGNVYVADGTGGAIYKLPPGGLAAGTAATALATGLTEVSGVAVDSQGNVYYSETPTGKVWKWVPSASPNSLPGTASVLIATGLNGPTGLALDSQNNLYIADSGNHAIQKWLTASGALQTPPLVTGLEDPTGVTVDSQGNVFIADSGNNEIYEYSGGTLTHIADDPNGVAVDAAGNVYFTDGSQGAVEERQSGYVSTTTVSEGPAAGRDSLPAVVPGTVNLSGAFAPTSDQSWLTINGASSGVVSFAFTANFGSRRTAHITVLGQSVAVTQDGPVYTLGTAARLEGPAAGSDSVVLATVPNLAPWTATTNATWLHLSPGNQSGSGSTNVVFSFDANPGATRTGTLTLGGQTVTVTQAGATYVAAGPAALATNLITGRGLISGLTVDGAGNLYVLDDQDSQAIDEWTPTNNAVSTLLSVTPYQPLCLALNSTGSLYVGENNGTVAEWTPNYGFNNYVGFGGTLAGVAVDSANNVYALANNGLYEWTPANNATTLLASGFNSPTGLAVDAAGNVYVADTYDNAIKKWSPVSQTVSTLVSTGLSLPASVAVDGAGNVYIADSGNNAVKEWSATSGQVATLPTSDSIQPTAVAVDGAGNVYFVDAASQTVDELPHAFVDPTPKMESGVASGNDSLPTVLPATANLGGVFAPTSDQSWLTITDTNNGVVHFAFTANSSGSNPDAHLTVLGQVITVSQTGPYALSASTRVAGPAGGSDSVLLIVSPGHPGWTSTANADWLHLNPASQSGTGSATVIFNCDANSGLTRTGTVTVAGQTLNVIQAGAGYVPATVATTLISGLNYPQGVAVDGAGNVFVADTYNHALKKWAVADNTVATLASGLNYPQGVAVDGADNVYVADNYTLWAWSAANGLTNLLNWYYLNGQYLSPYGLAVDASDNVYIADRNNSVVDLWPAGGTVAPLANSGLSNPESVAVDMAGNVYIADYGNQVIKEWSAANSNVTTVVASGLSWPSSVAVDVAGNLYVANNNGTLQKWSAASNTLTTLAYDSPASVAVDQAGNVYVAEWNNTVAELPQALVNPAAITESPAAGSDSLPPVIPASVNLNGPFAPVSDQPWLTITGTSGGVVTYAFTANTGPARTATISLLGQTIPVNQSSPNTYFVGGGQYLEGPAAGSDSVPLSVSPNTGVWTATTNGYTSWLHLSPANQAGSGGTNVIFTFDANPGATRYGSLNVAGSWVNVTQAGATYVRAGLATNLIATGLSQPGGLAVDRYAGNVYVANAGSNSIVEWTPSNHLASVLISTGLNHPSGVGIDYWGGVYVADTGNNAIQKWVPVNTWVNGTYVTTPYLTNLVGGLSQPTGVAFDSPALGIVFANNGGGTVGELPYYGTASSVFNVAAGLNTPAAVTVDGVGNIYIADRGANTVYEVPAGGTNVVPLLAAGLSGPAGVAVDGAGNVYVANYTNSTVVKWSVAGQSLGTLLAAGLNHPTGLALDNAGNLYVANTGSNTVLEMPQAYVDPTPRMESAAGGSDTLPMVLPGSANLSGPFTPVSDQPWLTITSTNYGMVSFSLPPNLDGSRTAHILLLGQSVAVTQSGPVFTLGTPGRVEGPAAGSDSVGLGVVPNLAPWTAAANAAWLHLSPASQSGTGGTNVIFSYDANPGATRAGTLTIGNQTFTVTQAGATYGPANWVTNLVATGLNNPTAVSVDSQGNVSVANSGAAGVYEWLAAGNTVTNLYNISYPASVAASSGSVSFTWSSGAGVYNVNPASGTQSWIWYGNLNSPQGLAYDRAGNLFVADTGDAAIKEWQVNGAGLTNLVTTGLIHPTGVAVDVAGNVYIADSGTNVIYKWLAGSRTVTVAVPASAGLSGPKSVAVDGGGNLFVADTGNNAIREWIVASNSLVTLAGDGLSGPAGVAVDAAGNVYFTDSGHNLVRELTRAFVDTTARTEGMAAGGDSLPVVLPGAENQGAPFAPASDQPWLSVTGITNGVVSFAFTATTTNRTGHVTVLGQSTAVTQTAVALTPVITRQPASQTVPIGGTARLSVACSSAGPLACQWYFNTTNPCAGATNLTFVISPAGLNQAGSYQAVISNQNGSTTSAAATLSVALQPNAYAISNGAGGAKVLFLASVPGSTNLILATTNLTLPLSQWQRIGIGIADAAGWFQFVDSNTGGAKQKFYTLELVAPSGPAIVTQPQNVSVIIGNPAALAAAASGTAPLAYQWYFNGAAQTGAIGAGLAFNPTAAGQDGNYQLVVTNLYGSATSAVARVTVRLQPNVYGFGPNGRGGFSLALAAAPQSTNRVWFSTNLASWQVLATNVAGPNGLFQFLDNNLQGAKARFYRLSTP